MEEVEDSPDFWSGPVQSYNSPIEYRFLTELDWSTNGLLPDCDHKYVSVRTMPPGHVSCWVFPVLLHAGMQSQQTWSRLHPPGSPSDETLGLEIRPSWKPIRNFVIDLLGECGTLVRLKVRVFWDQKYGPRPLRLPKMFAGMINPLSYVVSGMQQCARQLVQHTESWLLSLYSMPGFVYLGLTHYEYFPGR